MAETFAHHSKGIMQCHPLKKRNIRLNGVDSMVADPDMHYFFVQLDPDLHQSQNSRAVEPCRVCRAGSQICITLMKSKIRISIKVKNRGIRVRFTMMRIRDRGMFERANIVARVKHSFLNVYGTQK